MKKIYNNNVYMSVSLIILNILDAVTTIIGLKLGCFELNGIMRPIVGNEVALIALKILIPSIILYRIYTAYKTCSDKMKHNILIGLRVINIYYILVVCSNTISIVISNIQG